LSAKPDLLTEMTLVLCSTQSVDTFFVTLGLLEKMGMKAQPAIPAILRNAERLGIFKNHTTEKGRDAELVERVAEALHKIRAGEDEPAGSRPASCSRARMTGADAAMEKA